MDSDRRSAFRIAKLSRHGHSRRHMSLMDFDISEEWLDQIFKILKSRIRKVHVCQDSDQ